MLEPRHWGRLVAPLVLASLFGCAQMPTSGEPDYSARLPDFYWDPGGDAAPRPQLADAAPQRTRRGLLVPAAERGASPAGQIAAAQPAARSQSAKPASSVATSPSVAQRSAGQLRDGKRGDSKRTLAQQTTPAAAPTGDHAKALAAMKSRHWAEANARFAAALEQSPQNPDLLADYGYALYLQQEFLRAEPLLRQALRADETHDRARNNLGLVLTHLGRTRESLNCFRKSGTEAEAQAMQGYALVQKGDLAAARKYYAAALEFDPALAPALAGVAYLDQAQSAAGDVSVAVENEGYLVTDPLASGDIEWLGDGIAEVDVEPNLIEPSPIDPREMLAEPQFTDASPSLAEVIATHDPATGVRTLAAEQTQYAEAVEIESEPIEIDAPMEIDPPASIDPPTVADTDARGKSPVVVAAPEVTRSAAPESAKPAATSIAKAPSWSVAKPKAKPARVPKDLPEAPEPPQLESIGSIVVPSDSTAASASQSPSEPKTSTEPTVATKPAGPSSVAFETDPAAIETSDTAATVLAQPPAAEPAPATKAPAPVAAAATGWKRARMQRAAAGTQSSAASTASEPQAPAAGEAATAREAGAANGAAQPLEAAPILETTPSVEHAPLVPLVAPGAIGVAGEGVPTEPFAAPLVEPQSMPAISTAQPVIATHATEFASTTPARRRIGRPAGCFLHRTMRPFADPSATSAAAPVIEVTPVAPRGTAGSGPGSTPRMAAVPRGPQTGPEYPLAPLPKLPPVEQLVPASQKVQVPTPGKTQWR